MQDEVLIFECAGARFGLPASGVSEVVRAVEVTQVPQAPDSLLGMINLRGELVAVVSTRVRLGLDVVPLNPSHQFIIMRTTDGLFALHVDRAIDMISADQGSQAGDSDEGVPIGVNEGMVQYVAKTEQGILPVLEPQTILTDDLAQAIRRVTSTTATETDR